MSVDTEFTFLLKEATQHKLYIPYEERKIYFSSLPYCGLRHYYHKLANTKQSYTLANEIYLGVGKIYHQTLQQRLGKTGTIYGNWRCCVPGCSGVRVFSNNNRCPVCSATMLYKELVINSGLSNFGVGMLDGLYKDSDKKFWVVDYKTTSCKGLRVMKEPYKTNVQQVRAYCAVGEKQFKLPIHGWILIYITRDHPNLFKVFTCKVRVQEKQQILNKLKLDNEHYSLVTNGPSWEQVKQLIEERPCRVEEQYEQGYEGCPLASQCLEDSVKKYVKRLYNNN